jgi:DNA polymerase-4
MSVMTRTILHVDMDAFYASVEQRDNPQLRGKPVVVGGGSNRGVVAAASYEVRKFGVRSAMPIAEATRRCPQLIRVAPRMAHYQAISAQIFTIFREFTPLVEGLSLDEAFLDVTASEALHGSGGAIAEQVKQQIQQRMNLTASVGVAENKLVAKIASDLDKPNGLVIVTAGNCRAILDPLPVAVIPGIGPQTLRRLHAINIRTIADLRGASDRDLEPVFGRYTHRTRERAGGIDNRPVVADFQTFTRQKRLQPPASSTEQIFRVARELLGQWLEANPDAHVRLLGVGGHSLSPAGQGDLFAAADPASRAPVDSAMDRIREKFGTDSVSRARTLERP